MVSVIIQKFLNIRQNQNVYKYLRKLIFLNFLLKPNNSQWFLSYLDVRENILHLQVYIGKRIAHRLTRSADITKNKV